MKCITDRMRLDGRSALITGGAGHIGRALGEVLLDLGARLAVLDLDLDVCRHVCSSWASSEYVSRSFPIACDLADEKATREAVHRAKNMMGGLDILIHSAAFVGTTQFPGWAVPFEEQTVAAWEASFRVNLTAAFVLVQEARPYLAENGMGSVIFLGSIYGAVGPDPSLYEGTAMVTPAAYVASKGGLHQLTRYLATQLAPEIRVNSIIAGGVYRNQPEIFVERYKQRTLLRRMATEEDLQGIAAFLAGDGSAYVTGTAIPVDGGWTAW